MIIKQLFTSPQTRFIMKEPNTREKILDNSISTSYMKIEEQIVDLFTKALNRNQVDYLCNKLGMINISNPA
ncbi:gag-pol polyprotein [Gossypium australe]|uniref:Gag-pol polyprotein n=1 Tax=Gossypium australe TaxID=47621 RepID=A0A5B6WDD7_9ROSI|nr:gag-pol polyprotein [Gossypium australe]